MLNDESLEDRQRNEFEVLKSIYSEDIKDLRTSQLYDKWQPLNLIITLTPQQGHSGRKDVYLKLDLHVICTANYPNKIPELLIRNTRGLSKSEILELQNNLEEKANELKGEVMIFELAQYVQVFLHEHNKPATKSFYEEMVIRQQEKEQLEKEAKQNEKERERKAILNEIAKRQEILMQEHKLRREHRLSSENSNEEEFNRSFDVIRKGSSNENSDDNNCNHKGTKIIEFFNNGFREIQRGKCLSHSKHNYVSYSAMDIETGEIVLVSEWAMAINSNTENIQIKRHVTSIEQEFNYIIKLKHPNLAHYLNIKHEFSEEEKRIVIHTLQEFVFGSSCKSLFICESISIDIDMLQHIATGVLSALDYLHRNNVVHKKVCGSCVFINQKGVVKLANYSLYRRLSDLLSQKHSTSYGKKTDVFNFGLLMLSLLKGTLVPEESFEIPHNIPNDLYNFLNKCLAKDEKDRYTTNQLLHHSFLQTPLERFSPKRTIEESKPERNSSPENQIVDFKLLAHSNSSNQSRIQNEFEVLDCLGKGAFGEVFKVKNKLDQCCYAIKKIELNPKNKQLNKKIIREVKLLSKLNHENVVRYYNSWIETAIIENSETDGSTISTPVLPSISKMVKQTELVLYDDVEVLAPPIKDVEWSVSYESKSKGAVQQLDSSEDESDDDWGVMLNLECEESNSIEFAGSDTSESASKLSIASNRPVSNVDTVDSCKIAREIQFMYIQMEFCEKSTLRTAIDGGLYKEQERVWKLFREIVEGLAHIHQQGMIHRDLKPVNIFLDYNNHVKIGDFGLATTSFLSRINESVATDKNFIETDKDLSHITEDGSMTGHVGTALYVAPELSSIGRVTYNQKVDIYSLGIIFFEMCYKPLSTSMERIKILTKLRTKDIIFPSDFKECASEKQEFIIRWLLDHDVSQRPSSDEVLQSDDIPPPVLEECELRELIRHTLNNPQLKAYKYLVESCFKQRTSAAQDLTYDRQGDGDESSSVPYNLKNIQAYDYIKKIITKIFNLHGGQHLATPLLMPSSKQYYLNVESYVNLMTHSGSIVSVPHDLRVPFARYIAWNGITCFRRFLIERVYREKKVFGFLPRELYECAFDIVTPTPGNFMADAELLYILNEIVDNILVLRNKNFFLQLNHTSLLKSILLHCGIKEKYEDVYNILSKAKVNGGKVSRFQVQTHLISLGLSDNAIENLFNLIEVESPISKAISYFQMITKRKATEASHLAKEGLQELKMIIENAQMLGVQLPILITPGLIYNVQHYSGMMCQLVCEFTKKRRGKDVLAAGGRYDKLIASYRSVMEEANMIKKDIKQSAVGISISLDKLVQIFEKEKYQEKNLTYLDAIICSPGTKTLLKEKSKILRDLWSANISCCLMETMNLEEVQEQCTELNVPHLIILNDAEQGVVRVRSWERGRFQEKKINTSELVDNMQRIIKLWNEGNEQGVVYNALNRSDSKVSTSDKCEHTHDANVNILFVTESEKLSANTRKRFDSQIRSQMDGILKKLSGEVVILALNLEVNLIRTLVSYLDFENEHQFYNSVKIVIEKHQKYKKYLTEICDEIYDQKSKPSTPILVLYSLNGSYFRMLL